MKDGLKLSISVGGDNDPSKSVVINIDGVEPGTIKLASQIPPRENRTIPPAPPAVRRTSAPRTPIRRDFYSGEAMREDMEAASRSEGRSESDADETPVAVYDDPNSAFDRVEVYKWRARYRFYEKFAEDAERLIRKCCAESPFVPFYSALPQYSAMNMAQLRYYLWWRHNVRRGTYPPADTGYLLLYIFDIINLPEIIPPKTGMAMLCAVYREYRAKFAHLGKQMAEWICDYSLIHNIKVPLSKLAGSEYDLIKQVLIPDVVIQTGMLTSDVNAVCVAAGKNYRDSQYYRDEYKEPFDRHIPAASLIGMRAVIEKLKSGFIRRTEIRDTYFGAVISSEIKRKVVIHRKDVPSLDQVTAAAALVLKYAENRTRALCSIPSRFSVSRLPAEAKAAMDEYFAPFATKKKTGDDSYDESLYEAASSGINIENARKIEQDSWENAALFEDIYDDDLPEEGNGEKEPAADMLRTPAADDGGDAGDPFDAFVSALGEDGRALVSALLASDGDFRRLCAERRLLPDAAVEMINSAAADTVEDTVVEDGAISGFYREDIERAMRSFRRTNDAKGL